MRARLGGAGLDSRVCVEQEESQLSSLERRAAWPECEGRLNAALHYRESNITNGNIH